MKKVVLIHQYIIQHYRVSIYNYLYKFLAERDCYLKVISGGIEKGNPYSIEFDYSEIFLNYKRILECVEKNQPDVAIFFVNLKNLYIFPLIFYLKIKNVKIIYWGHGFNLQKKNNTIKNIAYMAEHSLFDAIILYADHLKQYIASKHHHKIFVAPNTLNMNIYNDIHFNHDEIKSRYGITTSKNIICMGRMQKRKRIDDLIQAFILLDRKDIGLILVGPDVDNLLSNISMPNIYQLSPVYGEEAIRLLSASDVYCLPGAVGLSIVDAFYCGLPFITENVDHGPEIMYLKNNVNGFVVEKGDITALANKLDLILSDDFLRKRMSINAKIEISTNGHIKKMSKGFINAINFVSEGR